MSTNNFSYENILVVCPDFVYGGFCSECEEKGIEENCEHIEQEFDNFYFEEYCNEMRAELADLKVAKNIDWNELNKSDNDRNYTGKIIGEFIVRDKNEDGYKNVYIVIRNGYYSGMNIDYVIEDNYYYESEISKSEENRLDKQVEVLCKKIEKLLRKIGGTEYLKVAQFSNGEAMYKKK